MTRVIDLLFNQVDCVLQAFTPFSTRRYTCNFASSLIRQKTALISRNSSDTKVQYGITITWRLVHECHKLSGIIEQAAAWYLVMSVLFRNPSAISLRNLHKKHAVSIMVDMTARQNVQTLTRQEKSLGCFTSVSERKEETCFSVFRLKMMTFSPAVTSEVESDFGVQTRSRAFHADKTKHTCDSHKAQTRTEATSCDLTYLLFSPYVPDRHRAVKRGTFKGPGGPGGSPSPTHSHQEQMALAGLASLNEPLLSLDVA
ncbi:uncharacterized protein V6R79_000366 [Siganus canaliculatus]